MDVAKTDVPHSVIEAIRRMREPIVIAHVVPDADALGSMLAVARAFRDGQCRPRVALPPGSVSKRLTFMVEWAQVAIAEADDFPTADGFIVVDTARKSRCEVGRELAGTDWSHGRCLVNIDHHETNTRFGDQNWVVDQIGSTCELIYYLLRQADRPIDPVTASCLFAGIQTDTLGFSLPTTTASALQASAELVALGANVSELGERLYRSRPQSDFDLLRVVYANTRVLADGGLAYSSASYDEIRQAGCGPAEIDDQINVPRSLEGVRLAMLFTEGQRGRIRINFRGSGPVTVVELAAEFGGGGHRQAAGAVVEGGLAETMDKVLPRAVEHLRKFEEKV